MADRPIIFSAPMVLALLAGRKTQTRRLVKGRALEWLDQHGFSPGYVADPGNAGLLPYSVGDRLWVREAWRISADVAQAWPPGGPCVGWLDMQAGGQFEVAAPSVEAAERAGRVKDWDFISSAWRPSIHMPRWASRLTLPVTQVACA